MRNIDKHGEQFCQLGKWLGVCCIGIGILMGVYGVGAVSVGGVLLGLFGAWAAFAFTALLKEPGGLSGWKLKLVTPAFERAVHRDMFARGPKDSHSTLHAAKRFTVFMFTSCLTCGLLGFDALLPSIAVGTGCALVYDQIVRRRELKGRRGSDEP